MLLNQAKRIYDGNVIIYHDDDIVKQSNEEMEINKSCSIVDYASLFIISLNSF